MSDKKRLLLNKVSMNNDGNNNSDISKFVYQAVHQLSSLK
jgi:hypothetical protein